MENKKLKVGEKYLTLDVGGAKVSLFPVDKKNENSPDFKGTARLLLAGMKVEIPMACWVNKKKESTEVKQEVI